MTNLPKMVPSAEERAVPLATQIARRWLGPATVAHSAPEVMVNALNRAFRDGAIAERERILALLRNTDPLWMNKLREEANDLLLPDKNEQIYRSSLGLINIQVRAVLSAIAAKIGGEG